MSYCTDLGYKVGDVEKVQPSVTSTEQTFTKAEITEALQEIEFEIGLLDYHLDKIFSILNRNKLKQSDDYKEYIRLKEKLGL